MLLSKVVVVWIVGWSKLDCSSTKLFVHVFVCNDGQSSVRKKGMDSAFTDKVFEPFILSMHCNAGISKHGLLSSGGNLYCFVGTFDGILEVGEDSKLDFLLVTRNI